MAGAFATFASLIVSRPADAGRAWIEDPTGRTVLQVAFRGQPTYQDLAETEAALTRMASILCDATEGQLHIAEIRLFTSPASEDLAALWIHDRDAASGGPYDAGGADLRRLGAHMDVFESARLRPDRLAHLFAHHAFGLGDQYDDQRRRGEACGVGPGFEPGQLDEKNHSIMQAAGGMRCVDGPLIGQDCIRDDQCRGSSCEAALASEWSTPSNHDRVRGSGESCPRPSPVTRVRLRGILPAKAEPVAPFDTNDYLSARATSVWQQSAELLGPAGTLPGVRLRFYLSHTSRLTWQLSVGADAGEFGGTPGELVLLRSWELLFNSDFSLRSSDPSDLLLKLPPSAGRGPAEVAIDVGTRNPDAANNPGQGYDGLQMVAAGTANVELATEGGVVGCTAAWCASSWNTLTRRWETSEQSLLHRGASDWQTLSTNLPFLMTPPGEVNPDPPALCRTPPQFVTDIMGPEQVVFILDTSRSMGLRVDGKSGEVCANGVDDDGDKETDEADCADSRLEYERVAVRAFLALADDRKLQASLIAMHTDAEISSELADVNPARLAVLDAVLGSFSAEGDTAMGTALERSQEALQQMQQVGRSRTVILLSDGVSNIGVEPGQETRRLDPLLYRTFTIGVGTAVDELTLSAIAARSGGVAYATRSATGAPAIYAELAARHGGNALVFPRTTFDLARPGEAADSGAPAGRTFEIPVEGKARELVIFLASRNDRIDDWHVLYDLESPEGQRFDDAAAENHAERGFAMLRISDPKSGTWKLRVVPRAGGVVRSELVVFSSQDNADFFIDADPRFATVRRSVHISARPSYVSALDGDVAIDGSVLRPDGSEEPVTLVRDPLTQDWGADFDRFAGRGYYEVRLRLRVGSGAVPSLGEPIFPGPSRLLLRVAPFVRSATASFFVADGPQPVCTAADCDGDGLADKLESVCPQGDDADRDGTPNRFDADSDNDEIFDGEEGLADIDKDGAPDFCDPETTPDSLSSAIEAEEAATLAACGPDVTASRDALKASLSAVRRIMQVVRTHAGVPADARTEIVQKLEKVIGLKKQAVVIADVLPEFCEKYQARLKEALAIERELRVRVDPYLVR
ncbi:MAG TPA: vWA domain-containing protein [Candidatus Limnocylindrales bacterium]|nr:vWA domain-containing protein [Candidatus Limnocylindrales bacterium]